MREAEEVVVTLARDALPSFSCRCSCSTSSPRRRRRRGATGSPRTSSRRRSASSLTAYANFIEALSAAEERAALGVEQFIDAAARAASSRAIWPRSRA